MSEARSPKPAGSTGDHAERTRDARVFVLLGLVFQAALIALFAGCVAYDRQADPAVGPDDTENHGLHVYPYFTDVHVMIFIGFGYLMTCLRKYGYSALGLTFFLSALCFQWAILNNGFWNNVKSGNWVAIPLEIPACVEGDFAAGAVMITFGVVIGKATQLQLLLIAFWEILFYALNKVLVEKYILASDIGGTMVIHTFGAYFGLAVSMATKDKESIPEEKHENQATAVQADLFSMVGTIFLWIMWPSFNSALGLPGPIQQRAIINTLLSLCCACVTVVLISTALRPHHKIDMEDIQNATLAGGVAVGASANMALFPAGAMAVGVVSGLLSAVGFRYVQGFLKRTIGLHDSCGVHNLHGMPGVFGSLVSCAVAGAATYRTYGAQLANNFPGIAEDPTRTAINQGAHQFAALILTLSLAITTGLIVGMCIRPLNRRDMSKFDDSALFHVPATV